MEDKKLRLAAEKKRVSLREMKRAAEEKRSDRAATPGFYEALKKPGISIIGEFKNASPSLGRITNKLPLKQRMEEYNASADAVSCLTEEDYFHGGIDDFKRVRELSALPIIRSTNISFTNQKQ